ncbi:LCP family protein [Brevibacillus massiliensis]|uniref:LCP family protein n=1 Tax=Brevibacillus massiliensis TaxID=1118054 RepID=UPI0002F3076A|nr:LCP family protein [Brevibacillus massiliensis]
MPNPPANGSAVQTDKRAKQKRRRKLRRMVTLFVLFAILLVGGAAGAVYWKLNQAIESVENPYAETNAPTNKTYEPEKPLSVVLLGFDSREETGSLNTDVMMVSVINPATKKVQLLSIPRDTRVKIPGYSGYYKINSAFAYGESERRRDERNGKVPTENGVTLTKKTLEQMLGIPIQYYITVDFNGFKSIIDELGGVEVNVDSRLVYHDPTDGTTIDLQPGLQTLNGKNALDYVRHRHDDRGTKYYSSDFDRNRRQQEVIKAVLDKMTSPEGFTKLFTVIDVALKNVNTDLSPSQIKGLAKDFKGFSSSDLTVLDSGAYWNSSIMYTLLPEENLQAIRSTLQTEMGITSAVAELDDSSTGKYVNATASGTNSVSSSRKTTRTEVHKVEKEQTKPEKQADPVVKPEGTEETPADTQPPLLPGNESTTEPSATDGTQEDKKGNSHNSGTSKPDPGTGNPPDAGIKPPAEQTTPPPDIPILPQA